MDTPRVRFAPSPTGQIHIGNIRTAIFNWLVARGGDGAFLLRLEDTDRQRSTNEAVRTVLDTLSWLGLDPDEEPVYQGRRTERHLEVAERLLRDGRAYRSDLGRPEAGEAILFRMPGRDMVFHDEIKGELRKPADSMKDPVIVRSNGTPVFHLANVVDDIDMGVNLVIRGDDHVENTYRHAAIYEALDTPLPRFAHLPMIVNDRGRPYSKRDGDAFVGEFRDHGYLPDALVNFLALLGWSPGDDREFMPRDELVASFSLDRVQSSPAQFDADKLRWLNGRHMETLSDDEFLAGFRAALAAGGIDPAPEERVCEVAALLRGRVKVFDEAPEQARWFFEDDYPFEPKAVRKRLLRDGARDRLAEMADRWEALDGWDEERLDAALRALAEERDVSAGQYIHPARVAVTGAAAGPGLFELLTCLGRDRVLGRLRAAVARLDAGEPFPAPGEPADGTG